MPAHLGKRVVLRDSYCSTPPLTTPHVLLPPRLLSRAEEACRPRAPLLRPTKREVRESEPESVKFVVAEEDVEQDVKIKQEVEIKADPRQLCHTARISGLDFLWRGPRALLSYAASLPHPVWPARPSRNAMSTRTTKRVEIEA